MSGWKLTFKMLFGSSMVLAELISGYAHVEQGLGAAVETHSRID